MRINAVSNWLYVVITHPLRMTPALIWSVALSVLTVFVIRRWRTGEMDRRRWIAFGVLYLVAPLGVIAITDPFLGLFFTSRWRQIPPCWWLPQLTAGIVGAFALRGRRRRGVEASAG